MASEKSEGMTGVESGDGGEEINGNDGRMAQ